MSIGIIVLRKIMHAFCMQLRGMCLVSMSAMRYCGNQVLCCGQQENRKTAKAPEKSGAFAESICQPSGLSA